MKTKTVCRFNVMDTVSEPRTANLNCITDSAFNAESVADELDRLGDALLNEDEIYIDEEGVIHTEQDMQGLNTLEMSNMTKVNKAPFAVEDYNDKVIEESSRNVTRMSGYTITEQGEVHGFREHTTDAAELINKEDFILDDSELELQLDEEGVIQGETDIVEASTDSEQEFEIRGANLTKVTSRPFAAVEYEDKLKEGTPCGLVVTDKPNIAKFTGADYSPDDSVLELQLDEEGVIQGEGGIIEDSVGPEQELEVRGTNMTRISQGIFAANDFRKPSNPDQWYNKNPILFKAEVASMRKRHPRAVLGFFKTTGNMYWIMEAKVVKGMKPWIFLLEYEKNHPNNDSYGGSIHVQLLKSPTLDELRQRAMANGRKGIPHIVSAKRANGESYSYLCTRLPQDVNDGKSRVSGAAQVAGWATDWALHFETGIRNKEVWNKWCDDSHFRHLMIP